ncbi:MAG: Na+/H+ antiporter NhaA [Acidimicrobiia bacterium]
MGDKPEPLHRTWINSNRFVPTTFVSPVRRFMALESASGLLMLLAAIAAVIWANSGAHETYESLLHTDFLIEVGPFRLEETLGHLINDGLMALFFFVVGLEIKRALVLGELKNPKDATLPVLAALGGMLTPALIYVAFTAGDPDALRGWAIPVATDIAFALGVLSLLGRRVPPAAKMFLLALAIVDDLGGILVIALFYTSDLDVPAIGLALVGLGVVWLLTRIGIRSEVIYIPIGFAVWYLFLVSGVHATLAGVALGFLTPARPMYGVREFDTRARKILDIFPASADTHADRERADHEAFLLAQVSRESIAPLNRWEHTLTPWVSFLVVPLFALANAGVRFEGSILDHLLSNVALGVGFGLVIGKVVGITAFSWLAVRLGLSRLPAGTDWRQMFGVAATAGIGFTVALFITALAFDDPVLTDAAKVGIFAGSIISGMIGVSVFVFGSRRQAVPASDNGHHGVEEEARSTT